MAGLKERVDRHDREIAAIRKLILTGMKMLVKSDQNLLRLEAEQMRARKEIQELRAQQRATARELEAFIRSLRRGTNGHSKRRFDIQ